MSTDNSHTNRNMLPPLSPSRPQGTSAPPGPASTSSPPPPLAVFSPSSGRNNDSTNTGSAEGQQQQQQPVLSVEPVLSDTNSRVGSGSGRRKYNFSVEDPDMSTNNDHNYMKSTMSPQVQPPNPNDTKKMPQRVLALSLSPSPGKEGSSSPCPTKDREEPQQGMRNERTLDADEGDDVESPAADYYTPPLPPLTNFILRSEDGREIDNDTHLDYPKAGQDRLDGSVVPAITEDEKRMMQQRVTLASGAAAANRPSITELNGSRNLFATPRFQPYASLLPESETSSVTDSGEVEEGGNRHPSVGGGSAPSGTPRVNTSNQDFAGEEVDGNRPKKSQSRTSSFGIQLRAVLRRTLQQYWRNKVGMLIEILSPLVFVVLVIVLNVAAGTTSFKATSYFKETSISNYIAADFYTQYLCYGNAASPIPTLNLCSNTSRTCSTDDESGIPVSGICTVSNGYNTNTVLISFIHALTQAIIAVPTLDEMIMYQWLAKKGGFLSTSAELSALSALQSLGMGVSGKTRYNAITYSGLLYFGPKANVPDDLISYFESRSELFPYVYGGIFDTDDAATAYMEAHKNDDATSALNATWAYISIGSLEKYFDVKVHMHAGALPAQVPIVSMGYAGGYSFDGTDMYITSGFTTLQQLLYDYFLSKAKSTGDIVTSYVPADAYPVTGGLAYVGGKSHSLFSMASVLVAFILVLSYLYPFAQMTRRIVLEKELRIREAMLIMGLRKSSLWCSVFLVYFLEITVITILLTILLCTTAVTHCNPFILFSVFYLFSLSLVPLSCLVSTLFSKARLAALLAPLIYFVISIPVFVMSNAAERIVLGVSVFSPTALASVLGYAMEMENGDGFWRSDIAGNPLLTPRPYKIMIMMGADVVLYFIILFYLDAVVPQEWGSTKHPLFFIIEPFRALRRCCCRGSRGRHDDLGHLEGYRYYDDDEEDDEQQQQQQHAHMTPGVAASAEGAAEMLLPEDTTVGKSVHLDRHGNNKMKKVAVQIYNLVKTFRRAGKRFKAVDRVCWKMYKGDISVLLGPNGAGKSTIINMITGMVMPDKGDCIIAGFSVRRELDQVRHSVGYCPQHNILWPDLTCREHIEFFAKIKGIEGAALEAVVQDALAAVDLRPCIDQTPGTLSGGQKRKLSVAIAFAGRNQVVLLDEPTAGMDAGARRHTWSLLRSMAARHTILLTTHFMDEADLLGDHIAVVNNGAVQCTGSPQHLRREAGSGYLLHFDLRPLFTKAQLGEGEAEGDEQLADRQRRLEARWSRIEQLVLSQVPVATVALRTDTEVEYFLPLASEPLLPNVLRVLEKAGAAALGTRAYTLTAPTLEDAFINVVEGRVPELRETAAQAAMQMKQFEEEEESEHALPGGELLSSTLRSGVLGSAQASTTAHSWARRLSRSSVRYSAKRGAEEPGSSVTAVLPGNSIRHRSHKPSAPTILSQLHSRKDKKTGLLPIGGGSDHTGAESEEATAVAEGVVLFSTERADKQLELLWHVQPTMSTTALLNLQFRAMLKKRFFFALRDRRMQFFQIVCPVLCILLAMLLQLVQSGDTFTMEYAPSFFREPHLLDAGGCNSFYGDLSAYKQFPYDTYAFAQKPSKEGTTYDSGLYDLLVHDSTSYGSAANQDVYLQFTWSSHSHPRYGSVYCNDAVLTSVVGFVSAATLTPTQTVYYYGYNTSSLHSLPHTMASHHYLLYLKGLQGAGRLSDTAATVSDSSTDKSTMFRLKLVSLPKATSSSATSSSTASILISVIVLIPFTFLPANPVAWVVRETEIQARHQQRISGLRYAIYWLSNFCFDYIAYLITLALVFIIFWIFKRSEFIGKDNVGAALLSFLLYGLCVCWAAYAVSFAFHEHTTAQMVVLGTSFLTGFILVLLVFVLNLMESTQDAAKTMRWVFRPVPSYAIGEVILNLAFLASNQLTDTTLTAWSMTVTGYPMIFLGGESLLFFIITFCVDNPGLRALRNALRRCCCCCCNARQKRKMGAQVQEQRQLQSQMHLQQEPGVNQEADDAEATSANGSIIVLPGDVSGADRRKGLYKAVPVVRTDSNPPQPLSPADLARGSHHSGGASHDDPNDVSLTPSAHTSSVRGRRRISAAFVPFGTGSTPNASQMTQVVSTAGTMAPYGDTPVAEAPQREKQPVVGPLEDAETPAFNASGSTAAPPLKVFNALYQLPTVLAAGGGGGGGGGGVSFANAVTAGAATGASFHRLVQDRTMLVPCRDLPLYPPKQLQKIDADILIEDIDVMDERQAVYDDERRHLEWQQSHRHERGAIDPAGNDVVRVVDLRKVYPKTHRVAVRGLSFGVMPREVFGFLGTNGAGKTTSLSILTQQQEATSGRAYVCGHDVERESAKAQQKIGYCPQFDTCYDLLTVKEHLDLYAAVRGLQGAERGRILPALLELMGLQLYKDVLSKDLSGGNRRKLSVAMSLLGMPEIVCLDEPSAGMDPLARRMMWRVLERVSRQCAIVLTTHHLEEVEALADTVAILAHGNLRCIGDLTHLKHKFANNAYELIIRIQPGRRRLRPRPQGQPDTNSGGGSSLQKAPVVGQRSSTAEGSERERRGYTETATETPQQRSSVTSNPLNYTDDSQKVQSRPQPSASIMYDGVEMIDLNTDIVLFMQTHFPQALLLENFCDERYVYSLPTSEAMSAQTQQLQASQVRGTSAATPTRLSGKPAKKNFCTADVLAQLQEHKEALHIAEYSLSLVSLEQVFLRVTAEEDNMTEGEAALQPKEPRGRRTSFFSGVGAARGATLHSQEAAVQEQLLLSRHHAHEQLEQSLQAANLSLVDRGSMAAVALRPDVVARRASLPAAEMLSPPHTARRSSHAAEWAGGVLSFSHFDADEMEGTSRVFGASLHSPGALHGSSVHRRRVAARPVGEPSPSSPTVVVPILTATTVVPPANDTHQKKEGKDNNNNNNNNNNNKSHGNYTFAQFRRMKAQM